jgi:hypothetical protein
MPLSNNSPILRDEMNGYINDGGEKCQPSKSEQASTAHKKTLQELYTPGILRLWLL